MENQSFVVNTNVVQALMQLRQIDELTLSRLVHVTYDDLSAWLYGDSEEADERVAFETQLEILNILGISREAPRNDIVHYWFLSESLFSRAHKTYWPLQMALKAFGPAQMAYIARESDPMWAGQPVARFGLRFAGFYAILEVSTHPLRSVSLSPDLLPELSWIPETTGVLLPAPTYDALEPGAMKVKPLQEHLTYTAEVSHWNRLRETALSQGLTAEKISALLTSTGALPPPASPSPDKTASRIATSEKAPQAPVPTSEPAPEPQAAPAPVASAAPVATPTDERSTAAVRHSAEAVSLFTRPAQGRERIRLRQVS